MTQEEFIKEIRSILSEFEATGEYNEDDYSIDNYWLNKEKNLYLIILDFEPSFSVFDEVEYSYESPVFDTHEEFLDELVIYKELILPKYL